MKDTREEILLTAFRHFLLKSYREVTIEHLVNELKLSKGAFYHHFKSKQELFIEVINRYIIHYIEFEEIRISENKTMLENLIYLIGLSMKIFERFMTKITPEADELNYYRMMLDAIKYYPGFNKVVNEKHKKGEINYYRKLIENAKNNGEIRENIDTKKLAVIIQALIDGIGFNILFNDNDDRDYIHHISLGLEFFFEQIKVQPSTDKL